MKYDDSCKGCGRSVVDRWGRKAPRLCPLCRQRVNRANEVQREANRVQREQIAARNAEIIQLHAAGTTYKELAERFAISKTRVVQIVREPKLLKERRARAGDVQAANRRAARERFANAPHLWPDGKTPADLASDEIDTILQERGLATF